MKRPTRAQVDTWLIAWIAAVDTIMAWALLVRP